MAHKQPVLEPARHGGGGGRGAAEHGMLREFQEVRGLGQLLVLHDIGQTLLPQTMPVILPSNAVYQAKLGLTSAPFIVVYMDDHFCAGLGFAQLVAHTVARQQPAPPALIW